MRNMRLYDSILVNSSQLEFDDSLMVVNYGVNDGEMSCSQYDDERR